MAQLYYDIGIIPKTTELAERFMFPFSTLNYLLNGGIFDRITLVTSGTDNGKTTCVSQILMHAIKQNIKTFAFYGEDSGSEARDRIYRQYLPYEEKNFEYRQYMQSGKATNTGEHFLTKEAWEKANDFFKGKLFIYNNNLPAKREALMETLEAARKEQGCRLFVLDNVEMFHLDNDNENQKIREICVELRRWAITTKSHIIIVAHIRKVERGIFRPEINDVKGTSALTNIAKNIFTIIRTDKLDRSTPEYRKFAEVIRSNGYNLDEADCVIEVRKTKGRGLGFVCLKFNKVSGVYYECQKRDGAEPKTGKPVLHRQSTIADFNDGEEDLPY